MKRVWCVGGLVLLVQVGFAQTFDEWFRQKKTQIKYLTEQIIVLQAYIDVAQKGYAIYRDGLGVIGDLKNGDFNLHKDYFSSLSSVKPSIGQSAAVTDIFQWRRDILIIQERMPTTHDADNDRFVNAVFVSLMAKVNDCAKETKLLTFDGHYQLTDEQRLTLLNKEHYVMQEYFEFAKWMHEQVIERVNSDRREVKDTKVLRLLLDIK